MSTIDQQFVEYIVKSLVGSPDDVVIDRIIDEKGVIEEIIQKVDTKNHTAQILGDSTAKKPVTGAKTAKKAAPAKKKAAVKKPAKAAKPEVACSRLFPPRGQPVRFGTR